MNKSELEQLLFAHTESEAEYAASTGSSSPRYSLAEVVSIRGRSVMYFHLNHLDSRQIILRKDSRYIEMPPYTYSSININYIYAGKCTYWIDGKKLLLHKGDVCIFDKGVIRAKERTGFEDIIINFNISDSYFQESLSKLENQNIISAFLLSRLTENSSHDNYIVFRTGEDEKVIDLFDRLLMEYYDKRPYTKEIVQHYLSIIVIELLLLHQTKRDIHSVHLPKQSCNRALEILFFIENHCASCTLKEVAQHFGYHEKYLCAYIKKYSGKTFQQIKREYRIREAVRYLLNTELPVHEIAERVGYSSRNQFYKEFRDACHMLPREYRKKEQI